MVNQFIKHYSSMDIVKNSTFLFFSFLLISIFSNAQSTHGLQKINNTTWQIIAQVTKEGKILSFSNKDTFALQYYNDKMHSADSTFFNGEEGKQELYNTAKEIYEFMANYKIKFTKDSLFIYTSNENSIQRSGLYNFSAKEEILKIKYNDSNIWEVKKLSLINDTILLKSLDESDNTPAVLFKMVANK